jgi:hypothetical protein
MLMKARTRLKLVNEVKERLPEPGRRNNTERKN